MLPARCKVARHACGLVREIHSGDTSESSTSARNIRLQLDGKHEKLVIEDRNVDLPLSVDRLCSALNRREARLAVLVDILVDRVHHTVLASHLDGFVEALLLVHALKHVRLQVAIDHE